MARKYHFPSTFHHATRVFLHDDFSKLISVTDETPHIVWTDSHQFVILHAQSDGSVYIFTNDNTVTKVPSSVHSKEDFDFRDCLYEEHSVSTFDRPDKFARCLQIDESDPELGAATKYIKTRRSLVGEFYDRVCSASSVQPETIHRRSLSDDSETHPTRSFSFRNFDVPTTDFYDCWYHPSNTWNPLPIEMFMCYNTSKDVLIHNHDSSLPEIGVMVRPPLAHQCGLNSCLMDNSVSKFLFKCPSAFTLSKDPENPTVQCKPKFSYLTSPISHLIDKDELDSLMIDVIISFARAWNFPYYRCRFEFDNRSSKFWTSKPINDRMIDVMAKPNHNVPSLLIANQYRAALNFPLLQTLIPDTRSLDHGQHLLSTVVTTSPSDLEHFDISTIPSLVFSFVDDMDARDRGYTWYYRHHHYILYMNVREPNLYVLGNLKINVFIDFKYVDGHLVRAWRRFEHVVRQHVITGTTDYRPMLHQEHPEDAKRFNIPGTNISVDPSDVYPFDSKFSQIEWTPVIIPCSHVCLPPKSVYQYSYNQADAGSSRIRGVRRAITFRNDFFNLLIRHNISHICTRTYAHHWKVSKYGPVSFLMCGSLINELNVLDFHDLDAIFSDDVMPSMSFITFSPSFGLCGFTPGMVHQFTEQNPVIESCDIKLAKLPLWPCAPNCIPPATLSRLKISDSPEFQTWLADLALNIYKIKYLHTETTSFKCSINKHAHWRVLTQGRYQAYFCNNFAMFGLNFKLPVCHPKRWIMAFCFTEEELSSLQWTKHDKYWIATLTNAIVTRQRKQYPLYSVNFLPTGDFCVFHMGRLGMAQPIIPPHYPYPPVHTSKFDANSSSLASLLKGSKMDNITPNVLEAMTLQVIQCHRSLEYQLMKLSLQTSGEIDPNPQTPAWKEFTQRLVSVFASEATLTPEMSQPEDGVDVNGVDDADDHSLCGVETVSVTRLHHSDTPFAIFQFDSDESFETSRSQQSSSSDSTL
jgi:hypothetical protein